MAMKDTATGYGWVSILLHWITAAVIVVMLYLGNSIEGLVGPEREQTLVLHTSIGITSYVLLWLRIIWRFVYGHPGALEAQNRVFFLIGKWVHLATIAALGVMLVSGPLMVWTMGQPIHVFDWFSIPTPFAADFEANHVLHVIHKSAAIVIFFGILLHLAGVYKHTAFNQDGTLTKIIIPAKAARSRRAD